MCNNKNSDNNNNNNKRNDNKRTNNNTNKTRTLQTSSASSGARRPCGSRSWVFITGGCSGRGVQWMGVVPCNKRAYNIM